MHPLFIISTSVLSHASTIYYNDFLPAGDVLRVPHQTDAGQHAVSVLGHRHVAVDRRQHQLRERGRPHLPVEGAHAVSGLRDVCVGASRRKRRAQRPEEKPGLHEICQGNLVNGALRHSCS